MLRGKPSNVSKRKKDINKTSVQDVGAAHSKRQEMVAGEAHESAAATKGVSPCKLRAQMSADERNKRRMQEGPA